MTAEQLKASVLQMAIEGKLVPQLDDEPAVDIEAVEPEEAPFSIPEKWKWVQLKELGTTQTGTTPSTSKKNYYGNYIPFVKPGDIVDNKVTYRSDGLSNEGASVGRIAPNGSVLMVCIGGTIGKVCYIDRDVSFNQQINSITPDRDFACGWYVFFALASEYFYKQVRLQATGTATPIIKKSTWQNILLPLPPRAEQERIVARLNEILPLIEEYGKAHSALKNAEQALPDQLRASLLQEAIQGKLVPQLEDEPAVEIAGEEPEEVPFAIPEKWKWVRIEDVFTLQAGKFIQASEIKEAGTFPCYGGNGLRGYVEKSNRKGRFPLIGRQGALCGNINMADGEFYATEHAVVVDCHEHGDPDCVGYFLRAMNLNQYATATAQPGLAVKNINKLFFPLPPLAEQRRIVARLEELLPHVDAIAGLR